MEGIAIDADSISKINEDTVKSKWMGNTDFVEFAFFFGRTVSHTKKRILDELIKSDSNLFDLITASDIAWAVTCYVNNKKHWEKTLMMKSQRGGGKKTGRTPKKKPARAGTRRSSPRKCKRRATVAEEEPEEEEEGGGGEEEEQDEAGTEKGNNRISLWTKQCKHKMNWDGWHENGKMFYDKVRKALKKIPADEWKGLWVEFWEREANNHVKKRKRDTGEWKAAEDVEADGQWVCANLFSDSDDEGEVSIGGAMEPV